MNDILISIRKKRINRCLITAFILFLINSLCTSLYGQQEYYLHAPGKVTMYFIASDSTQYFVTPYLNDNKTENTVSIAHRYYELGQDQDLYHYSETSIFLESIYAFKNDIKKIRGKFDEWKQIAIENGIINYEKRIPIDFTSIKSMGASRPSYNYMGDYSTKWYSEREAVEIYPLFKVSRDYKNKINYLLIIRLCFDDKGLYYIDNWFLTETDIEKLYECINIAVEKQRKLDDDKRKTDNLFH